MTATITPFMKWQDSWSVGISAIDTQHKHLVQLINDLHEALRQGKGKEVLGKLLAALIAYTKEHFSREESLIALHKYPDLEAHKVQHQKFTEKVVDFQRQYQSGDMVLTIDVMDFLSQWLRQHILGTDQKYAEFLHSKGVR